MVSSRDNPGNKKEMIMNVHIIDRLSFVQHTRKTVQEDMAKQPWEDQFETILGIDRYGARYIYFPQFIASDLRIYRLCLDNKILSTVRVMCLSL